MEVPADQVATSHGPLGIEQPFVEWDEWPVGACSLLDLEVTLEFRGIPQIACPEFKVPHTTILYGLFCLKYGWSIGPTEIWVESVSEFKGWKATRVSFLLDTLPRQDVA